MSDPVFEIGAPGIDVERVVAEIRAAVDAKMREGAYSDAGVARSERLNLAHLKDEEQMLACYLDCLRTAVFVDIGDFEIRERRAHFSGLLIGLKRTLWKLLKFYTYRLWSQQNQVNGLLLAAVEATESRNREKLQSLEKRLGELEKRAASGREDGGGARDD